ncbi:MAG: hypothetical protein H0U73_07990 [Tatlockia sp.]|nr:hypothetical protein [Tatlockia sp.]
MSEPKSKFPDLKEISSMAGKFFCDVKKSISEIFSDYKNKHAEKPASERAKPKTARTKTAAEKTVAKPASTPRPKKPKVILAKDDNKPKG